VREKEIQQSDGEKKRKGKCKIRTKKWMKKGNFTTNFNEMDE